MDTFFKQRLTVWIIALLVIFNLVTLGTLWYRETTQPQISKREKREFQRLKMEERFKKEVGLNQGQINQFLERRDLFFSKLRQEKDKSHQLNLEIVNEAFSDNPDMEKVNNLVKEIEAIEAKPPMLLFEHIQELKQIARPEQKEKLYKFFYNLFQNLGHPNRPPPGPRD